MAHTLLSTGMHCERKSAQAALRKESIDIYNRIHSVAEDTTFVSLVHETYPNLPLLPNLRCGAWYTDPQITEGQPAYFKSTDGHFGTWGFNLRRPNIHLLPVIVQQCGIILVDSTRAGKRMPDALSKTVPIWCAVINRALHRRFPDITDPLGGWDTNLYTPAGVVSSQEHHQIESRLDEWAESLTCSSYVLPRLRCPLRPMWITPSSSTFAKLLPPSEGGFFPVICVSASKQVHEGMERRTGGFSYVQGSADDHELWGMGLTPALFWRHRDRLLKANRSELPVLISTLLATPDIAYTSCIMTPVPISNVSGLILLCSTKDIPRAVYSLGNSPSHGSNIAYLVITTTKHLGSLQQPDTSESRFLRIKSPGGKKGQIHFLQSVLPESMIFIQAHLEKGSRVCIACDPGEDLGIGVALAALQCFFDNNGHFVKTQEQNPAPDKLSIRTRLQWIIASQPQANPSRVTLKRVNEFILTPSVFRSSGSPRSCLTHEECPNSLA